MLSAGAVCVNKVRVSGHHRDPLALRLRLDRILSAADFAPAGLPATAIVCIKRLRDPQPGLLDLSASSMRASVAWAQAVRERLAGLIAMAPRSARDRNAAADSDCVVFADKSDLLASLASDWCRGQVETRWWWRTLLRSSIVGGELLAIWRDAAEHIPAALARMESGRIEFARKLSDSQADDLMTAVAHRFALSALALPGQLAAVEVTSPDQEQVQVDTTGFHQPAIAPVAPWQKFVAQSSAANLSVARQRFLGVSLMLLYQPSIVRTRSFARAVEEWRQDFVAFTERGAGSEIGPKERALQASPKTDSGLVKPAPAKQNFANSSAAATGAAPDIIAESARMDPGLAVVSNPVEQAALPTQPLLEIAPQAGSDNDEQSAIYAEPATVVEPLVAVIQAIDSNPIVVDRFLEAEAAHEEMGDFVDHAAAAIPEATDSTLASRWEGEATDASAGDFSPAAGAMDRIARIETQFAGAFYLVNLGIYLGLYGDFTTPAEPGIEVNVWDFVAAVARELAGDQIEIDPVWPLLAELSGRELETGNSQLETPDFKSWLAELMPTVRRRLRLALGLEETADPGLLLIPQAGTVWLTATHIDVFFELANLPVEIRLAGLDRDPGWVPAAGRFIAFHFD